MGLISHVRTIMILVRRFGMRSGYVGLLVFRLALCLLMILTLPFDMLFFRRHAPVRPVFLIGHLRSGTTFFHRFAGLLYGGELMTLTMWDMLVPSGVLRKILAPLRPLLADVSLAGMYDPAVHRTGLFALETDDIALSFRFSDGLLTWLYFHVWAPCDDDTSFARAMGKISCGSRHLQYLSALYERKMDRNGRFLSKSFTMLYHIDELFERYPDAAPVFIIRDPREVIPSMMSLERRIQEKINAPGMRSTEERQYYFRQLYRTSLVYYRLLNDTVCRYGDRVHVVTHRALKNNLSGVMKGFAKFCRLPLSSEQQQIVRRQHEEQETFSSSHKYNLSEFGLSSEQIERDFHFIYENYDV